MDLELRPWNILVVDEKKAFFEISNSTFRNKKFENRSVQFSHANSISNAKKLLKTTPNFELIILCRMIRPKNSFQKFVRYLRIDLNNVFSRIILLVGKENDEELPSEEFFLKYDINNYLPKIDSSYNWHRFSIISALKAYKKQHKIETQKEKLNENNIFINNILQRLGNEKRKFEKNLTLNIEKTIRPIIKKINKSKIIDKGIIKLLEKGLNDLGSDFYDKVTNLNCNLTPAEIKICDLVKSGYLGKEIAEIMCISFSTVESHKRSIRKKLGISNTPTNLRMFLTKL